MGSTLHLNSNQLRSETEFHDEIERQLKPPVNGRNQDAFWDVLTELVEPPRVFKDAQAEFVAGDYILVLKV